MNRTGVAILMSLLAIGGQAHAERRFRPVPARHDVREEARALTTLGAQALGRGEAGVALEHFRSAYRLFPSARLRYNVGLALYKLGRDVDAYVELSEFLASAPDEAGDVRELALARTKELRARIGLLRVVIDVPDAAVTIDETRVGVSPLPGMVPLSPGVHQIIVWRDGYESEKRAVTLRPGDERAVALRLQKSQPRREAAPVTIVVHPPAPPQPRGAAIAGGVLLGLGAVVIGGGIGTAITGGQISDDLRRTYGESQGQVVVPPSAAGRLDDAIALQATSIGLYATGAVLGIAGFSLVIADAVRHRRGRR